MPRKPKPPAPTSDTDEAPKSAVELAMERLRRNDREAGVEERPLSDDQRRAIAQARSVYEAKTAEREIFHHAELAKAADPEALSALEEEYRRDRDRFASERDHKIEAIRRGEIPK